MSTSQNTSQSTSQNTSHSLKSSWMMGLKIIGVIIALSYMIYYQSALKQWFHPLWSHWVGSDVSFSTQTQSAVKESSSSTDEHSVKDLAHVLQASTTLYTYFNTAMDCYMQMAQQLVDDQHPTTCTKLKENFSHLSTDSTPQRLMQGVNTNTRESAIFIPSSQSSSAHASAHASAHISALKAWMKTIHTHLQSVQQSKDINIARQKFSQLSQPLFAIIEHSPSLQKKYYSFECPMVKGFQKWMQTTPNLQNPYMGQAMLLCGGSSTWDSGIELSKIIHSSQAETKDSIAYWTCAMHPSVKVKDPIVCPLCNMDLLAVSHESLRSGELLVDEMRTQKIGMRSAAVKRGALQHRVRAIAQLRYIQKKLFDVNIRTQAWIEKLYHWEVGERVQRGKILARYYSPQLVGHLHEWLQQATMQSHYKKDRHKKDRHKKKKGNSTNKSSKPSPTSSNTSSKRNTYNPLNQSERFTFQLNQQVQQSIKQRLMSLGLSSYLLKQMKKNKKVMQSLPLVAPSDGILTRHTVQQGSYVHAGQTLFTIAQDDELWAEVELFESQAQHVQVGDQVSLQPINHPTHTQKIITQVTQIDPYIHPQTRSQKVRILLDNTQGIWQAGMYVSVEIQPKAQTYLLIPYEAWLPTGRHDLVFLDLGKGRYKPVEIDIVDMNESWIAVTTAQKESNSTKSTTDNPIYQIQEGDKVVTHAAFLLSSESRLKSALSYWSHDVPPPPAD